MKLKHSFILIIAFSAMALITTSFFNGPANRGHDKTGSPLSNGSCMDCHSVNNFSPNLIVGLYDGEDQVTKYDPGKQYTLKYQMMNTGSPAVFGFQSLALNSNDESAGSFSDVPNGFRIIELNGADYLEHESPRPLSSFEVKWTAPSESGETISFYSGSVAANGNSSTSGDGADTDILVIEPNTSGIYNEVENSSDLFSIKTNKVQDVIELNVIDRNGDGRLYIFDIYGRDWLSMEMANNSFNSFQEINVMDLSSGFYFLRYEANGKGQTIRFYKD